MKKTPLTVIAFMCCIGFMAGFVLADLTSSGKRPVHAQSIGTWGSTFQQAVTASAVALPSINARAACVKANVANTLIVYVGNSASVTTSTGYALEAGLSFCAPVSNVNQLFVISTNTGSSVTGFTTSQ